MNRSQQGTANDLRGAYGEWLVHAIASSAGLSPQKPLPDRDGVDIVVRHFRKAGFPRSPYVEIQVKTESNPTSVSGDFRVSLRRAHHEQLRGCIGRELVVPRYLVLVHAPLQRDDLCDVQAERVTLRNTAYWASLMGDPAMPEHLESTTVSVPCANLLTPRELFSLVVSGDEEEVNAWMSA